jgi:hypothetical protein
VEFQTIISNKDITIEEIRAKRHEIQNQTFEQLVPHSELPPNGGDPIPADKPEM